MGGPISLVNHPNLSHSKENRVIEPGFGGGVVGFIIKHSGAQVFPFSQRTAVSSSQMHPGRQRDASQIGSSSPQRF